MSLACTIFLWLAPTLLIYGNLLLLLPLKVVGDGNEAKCPSPPLIINAFHSGSSDQITFEIGTCLEYKCLPEYKSSGFPDAKCVYFDSNNTAQWIGPDITCDPIDDGGEAGGTEADFANEVFEKVSSPAEHNSQVTIEPISKIYTDDPTVNEDETLASTTKAPNTETSSEVELKHHPNFHLLPLLTDCGYEIQVQAKAAASQSHGHRAKRIISGTRAGLGKYPWMVQILLRNIKTDDLSLGCGGTLINNDTVLTAAHCLTEVNPESPVTHVLIGSYTSVNFPENWPKNTTERISCTFDSYKSETICSRSFLVEVDHFVVHEKYVKATLEYDIGLVKLKTSVESLDNLERNGSSVFVRPICLPVDQSLRKNLTGEEIEVVGFGIIVEDFERVYAPQLQKISMDVVPNEECAHVYGEARLQIYYDKLCAIGDIGENICNADSGSPLMKIWNVVNTLQSHQIFQYGIASGSGVGWGCAKQGFPSTFTNVVQYLRWILDNLNSTKGSNRRRVGLGSSDNLQKISFESVQQLKKHPNYYLLPDLDICGIVPKKQKRIRLKRITGGRVVKPGTIPGIALIYMRDATRQNEDDGTHLQIGGTGVLINARYILTSLSAVHRPKEVNAIDSVTFASYEEAIEIDKIIIHEKNVYQVDSFDVALIRLAEPVEFTDKLRPICLPFDEKQFQFNSTTTTSLVTVGWGSVLPMETPSLALVPYANFMETKLLPNEDCDNVYSREFGRIPPQKFCAKSIFGYGTGLCGPGDRGAPLLKVATFSSYKKYTQIGLSSFAKYCGTEGFPTPFMNVTHVLQWILDNIEP